MNVNLSGILAWGHIGDPEQGWRDDSRGGGDQALGALEEKGPQVYQGAQLHLYNYCNCWKTVQGR